MDSQADCCFIYVNNKCYLKTKNQISNDSDNFFTNNLMLFSLNNNNSIGNLVLINSKNKKIDTKNYDKICAYLSVSIIKISDKKRLINDSYYDNSLDVKNCNSFISDCNNYQNNKPESIGIVYVDVNGLHEANNNYGHDYGDKILKKVKSIIKDKFRKEEIYRVREDKFIAMIANCDYDTIETRLKDAYKELCDKNISVSYGIAYSNNNPGIEILKSEADSNMYVMKNNYYGAKRRVKK